jgi:signal transduction histidine kinase
MQEPLHLLNQIAEELNRDLDLDNMLRRVIDLTVRHHEASSGSIMLFDRSNRVSRFILQQENLSDDRANRIVGKVLTEGFAGWVLQHRRSDIIFDTTLDERWIVYKGQPYSVRSAMAAPIMRRQRVLGVMTMVHEEPQKFHPKQLLLMNAISAQAGIALENANLFRETERERAKLSAIIHSSLDAVIVTADDLEIVLMNSAAERTFSIRSQKWDGRALTELIQLPGLTELFSASGPTTGELRLPNQRTLLTTVTDVPDVGRVAIMRDITALKALDHMKTEFITAFTHDLGAPLAAIKGYTELVRIDGQVTDRQEDDLGAIVMAADQMKTLIEDLLELTRIESIKELKREAIKLNDTISSTVSSFMPIAEGKKLELRIEGQNGPVVIDGNPALIARAIDNLVENAIKYTSEGGKVSVSLQVQASEVLISVSDTGPGIPAQDLPRVFDKFFRAQATKDGEIYGSGLGLSIVKSIAEQHGGRVWAESKLNIGSKFTLAFPSVRATLSV